MVPDAEKMIAELEQYNEAEAPAFKMKNDPRLIPIGRFLRKSSIDELPQLFNVLLGDMSLVGPRPMAVRDYSGIDKDWHRRRVSIRPGVTGTWQVSGRDSSSFDEWMKLDLQYIDRWSLLLDIKLLIQTIPAVLRGKGAV
jgi:lipopolysaccharide/colanic/teichoic acid biosynthesis glycosyltransferase